MTRTLLFEIGTEELPAIPLYKATEKLGELATKALDAARLPHGEVKTMCTPRRMALIVADVADGTEALEQRFRGPAAAIAFKDGVPTKAAEGFARGKGVSVDDLLVEDEGGKDYLFAVVSTPARPATEVLTEVLSALVGQIPWPKSQRWGSRHETFARPVRWLVALLGDEVIPATFGELSASNMSRGHRLLDNHEVAIASADAYVATLAENHVVASADERAATIRAGIARIEAETGLVADVPEGTFAEVVNLVEFPTVLVGRFEERFLEVPQEIITEAMLKHQRYFPLYTAEGKLANSFIITGNGDPACSETIIAGNERVVRPRLDDAEFFYREDLKRPLESYVDDLKTVVFQEKLGSVYNKTQRIRAVVNAICEGEGIDAQTAADAGRAALLAKADLVTGAVIEFTSQQGVMGGYYALAQGDNEAVAEAVADHYRPRFAGDELPRNDAGKLVALADKLDTICGIFAIDEAPTGSSDPYALRRGAIGIVNILLSGLPVTLSAAIDASLASYIGEVELDEAAVREAVTAFLRTRLEVICRDRGLAPDAVAAVLATGSIEPVDVFARAEALIAARDEQPELFADLSTAYARAANLADASLGTAVDAAALTAEERALYEAVNAVESQVAAARTAEDPAAALSSLASLRGPIDDFFEAVLVMDEDQEVRERRLRLLNYFVSVFAGIASLDRLV